MKPINWIGMLLIVLNALALAYQGINYTREKKGLDVGQAHITAETHEQVPISPILGGLRIDRRDLPAGYAGEEEVIARIQDWAFQRVHATNG
jgi:hypothetical protein